MLDYHMHTIFSADGEMTMEEACQQAVIVGLKEIAITDHMDIDLPDNPLAFQIKDMNQYLINLEKVKDQFKGRLNVKAGIEIGLQDWTLGKASALVADYPFDFVIASVHLVQGEDPYYRVYFNTRDRIKSYTDYYNQILELFQYYDDFNVLGHLDYLRRYTPFEYDPADHKIGKELIEAILNMLVQKGKGLELNTAGFRHPSRQPHPHPDILKWFRELGGEIVTVGSDAHSVQYVGYENKIALECLKYAGFDYMTSFAEMKPVFIKI
ncbi:MAG TPA: histidinol-phosphatase HisJ family protein [Clostridiales bacterium]|nr:histidinol-phosphatase HisJ family protein [Clostridiales bacterium]